MALVTTPGASNADCYVTLVESDSYIQKYMPDNWEDWVSLDAREKEAYLREATKRLDQYMLWDGYPTNPETQALQHPRAGLIDRFGNVVDENEILEDVKNATIELAYWLFVNGDDRNGSQANFVRLGDTIQIDYLRRNNKIEIIPKHIREMLSPWARMMSNNGQVRLIRC